MFISWGLIALLVGSNTLPRPQGFFDWPTQLGTSSAAADAERVCKVRRMVEAAGFGTPEVTPIQRFVSGHASYRVTTAEADFFLKLPCEKMDEASQAACDAEFTTERQWAAWAADRGVAPALVNAFGHTDALATHFVADQTPRPEEARVPPMRPRILQALGALHQTSTTPTPAGGRAGDVHMARALLRESASDLPVEWLHQLLTTLEQELNQEAHAVCHNDFHHRNVLVNDTAVFIID